MKKFCTNCGSELEEGAKFCGKCGAKVVDLSAMEKMVSQPAAKASAIDQGTSLSQQPQPEETMSESQPVAPSAATATEVAAESKVTATPADFPMPKPGSTGNEPLPSTTEDILSQPAYKIPQAAPTPSPQPVAPVTSSSSSAIYTETSFEDETLQEKYFTYHGRLNRKRYFLRSLVIFFALCIIGGLLSAITPVLGGVALIAGGVANTMLNIRRLHDLDKSGWIALIAFIPYVNVILGIYLLFFKGTDGPNKYGPDPLMYN